MTFNRHSAHLEGKGKVFKALHSSTIPVSGLRRSLLTHALVRTVCHLRRPIGETAGAESPA